MPSSYTTSLRFEQQFTGENVNLWGDKLSATLARVDDAVAGYVALTITGDYSLQQANTNATADEARRAHLKLTGSPTANFVLTIPNVSKSYKIWNATGKVCTVTTGSGATVTIDAGDADDVWTEGANVKTTIFGGYRLKDYIQASVSGSGNVPGPAGHAGQYLYADGTSFFFRQVQVGDVNGAAPAASPTFTGGITMSGSVKESTVAMAALDMDLSAGEFFTKSISANSTFTFSNLTASKAQAWLLKLVITSSAVPTFTGVLWSGGTAPVFGNGTHLIGFITFDGSTLVAISVAPGVA